MKYEMVRFFMEGTKEDDGKNPINFLKWNYVDKRKLNTFKETIKDKNNKKYKVSLEGNTASKVNIKSLSGIIEKAMLKNFVKNLIPYSFIVRAEIKLSSPYFSRDDDNFYLIQNPCLKETVFKVPMVRGSGWKGAIATAGKKLLNENENMKKYFPSFIRIFGAGSKEFRESIAEKERENKSKLVKAVLAYLLFELGKKLNKNDIEKIKEDPKNYLNECLDFKYLKSSFSEKKPARKGRAVFYPSYFTELSLEVINPHDRGKRAGTNPIHYEVVPKKTQTELQIVYIPFDGILMKKDNLRKQVENDLEFLLMCIERAKDDGIGAKTKLGWGRFKLNDKIYCVNGEIENKNDKSLKGWKECEAK